MQYGAIHCHSSYSLDGIGTIEQWVKSAKEKNLYGLVLTDHGDTSSILELKTIGKKESFPVSPGCEFYIINNLGQKDYYHITVIAKSFIGYQNLCRLSTISFRKDSEVGPHNNFYYKPRITFEDLFANKEGLIVCSGCLAGPLSKEILAGNEEKIEYFIKRFSKEFGDDYYLELQPSVVIDEKTSLNKQETVNRRVLGLYKSYQIPLVLAPDAHMLRKNQKVLQNIKLKTRSSKKKGWEFDSDYWLFTYDEFVEKIKVHHEYMLPYMEEAFANTNHIIDKSQFDLPEFPPLMPKYEIKQHPLYAEGDDQERLAIKIILNNNRFDLRDDVYAKRLKYELDTIIRNGKIDFLPYFLVLEDIVRWGNNNHVVLGPGRGSASGSLLSFALGLTHLDPIKFNLPFERFINKGRITKGAFPDIDLDFSNSDSVKKYVIEKYGAENVAAIGVNQTLKTKGAIKDVLSFLRPSMTFMEKNNLTNPLPNSPQDGNELDFFKENLLHYDELREFMSDNKDVFDATVELLGQTRQRGVHACSMVISPEPLSGLVPLWYDKGRWITQFDQKWCEKSGLIKFDFLSLNTLNDISYCVKLIKQNHNIDIDPYNLPLDDKDVFAAFNRGDSKTIFQFHTPIAIKLAQDMKVSSLNDLAAITSLGRPGPMDIGLDSAYIRRKLGQEDITYLHPALKDALKNTYGLLIFQENVGEVVKILGGFTLEEADDIRQAIGKKKKELIVSYKEKFIQNANKLYDDIDLEKATKIWDQIESFASYSFNLSHSCSYGLIGYICQFLKVHFPLEWYCSVLTNGTKEDRKEIYPIIRDYIVLPDINVSKKESLIKDGKILASLDFIEGVGDRSINEIISKSPFFSFEDFLKRVNKRFIKKDIILALTYAGVFDNLEPNLSKNELVERYFTFMKSKVGVPHQFKNLTEIDLLQKKHRYLSIGELEYAIVFKDKIRDSVMDYNWILNCAAKNRQVSIVGRIDKIWSKKTKKGDDMAFAEIHSGGNKLRLVLWPEMWADSKECFKSDNIMQIFGKVNLWKEKVSVICEDYLPIQFG